MCVRQGRRTPFQSLSTGSPPQSRRWNCLLRPIRSPSGEQKESPKVANIKSQVKRIRTNEKARLRNKAYKSELKSAVRDTRKAIEAGDKEAATAALQVASRKLDKAVSKGVIHLNQAANRKSALAKAVAAL